MSTDWLAAHLGDPGVRVVDVRGKVLPPGSKPRYLAKRSDYDAAHIPGRRVRRLDARHRRRRRSRARCKWPDPGRSPRRWRELGIGDETLVVAYDDYDHIFAGRLAWALRYYGHDGVRILDGGWSRWLAEGRPTDGDAGRRRPHSPQARLHGAPAPGASTDGRRGGGGRSAAPTCVLIDARPPEQYAGAVTAAARAGHIPGALNVPYARLVDASTGRFLARRRAGARRSGRRALTSPHFRAKSSSTAMGACRAPCLSTRCGCLGETTSRCTTAPGTSGGTTPASPSVPGANRSNVAPRPPSALGSALARRPDVAGASYLDRHFRQGRRGAPQRGIHDCLARAARPWATSSGRPPVRNLHHGRGIEPSWEN